MFDNIQNSNSFNMINHALKGYPPVLDWLSILLGIPSKVFHAQTLSHRVPFVIFVSHNLPVQRQSDSEVHGNRMGTPDMGMNLGVKVS